MKRHLILLYGVASYAVFFATFLYMIGFLGNLWVPKSIDSAASVPLGQALLIDFLLLLGFALQHSVMARPAFKRVATRIIPESAERSTYVLASSLALAAVFWLWQPLGGVVWDLEATWARCTLWSVFLSGWALILFSSFLINHFDLFGLRQVWLQWRRLPYTELPFRTPSLYRVVRHPLYVGWLLAFWATPTMTVAHLVFALLCTTYILAAIPLEERDLLDALPEYAAYREAVPMLLPRGPRAPAIHREYLA